MEVRRLLNKLLSFNKSKNIYTELSSFKLVHKINIYEFSINTDRSAEIRKKYPFQGKYLYSYKNKKRVKNFSYVEENHDKGIFRIGENHPVSKTFFKLTEYNPNKYQKYFKKQYNNLEIYYIVIGMNIINIHFDTVNYDIDKGYIKFFLDMALRLITIDNLNKALEVQAILLGLSRGEAQEYLEKIDFIGILNGNASILHSYFGFTKILFLGTTKIKTLFNKHLGYYCDYHKPIKKRFKYLDSEDVSIKGGFSETITLYLGSKDEEIKLKLWAPNYSRTFVRDTMQLSQVLTNLKTSFESGYRHFTLQQAAKQDQDFLKRTSRTDYLTKLLNRKGFYYVASKNLKKDNPMTLAELDIDHFKNINDTYGHDAGDVILKTLSQKMSDHFSRNSIQSRFGGEEFIICIPNLPYQESLQILRAFQKSIESHIFKCKVDKKTFNITCTVSIGVTHLTFLENFKEEDMENAFKPCMVFADKALYAAKNNGRNCMFYYNNESDEFLKFEESD